MPDTDTIDRVTSRKVQVASLPPADSGRGFARLPDGLMDELGLAEGDVIEIVGKRSTAARAIRPSVWTRPGSAASPASHGSMASTTSGRAGDVDAWSR